MPNLVLSGFQAPQLESVRNLLRHLDQLSVISTSQESAALAAIHDGITAAYCPLWSAAPTPIQLEAVQTFVAHRIPVIPVLDFGVATSAKLEAIRAGALDCVSLQALEGRFVQLVELFASRGALIEKSVQQKSHSSQDQDFILASPEMTNLVNRLSRVAGLGSTVLLIGETGVGKTTLARWIHNHSARSHNPFVEVSCASIPPELIEAELFGCSREPNASANSNCEGKLAAAKNGTLLLDEVDCLPLEVQAKLLRVVEKKKFERVGSSATESFDARLIVAANRPLDALVAQGQFRSDLYYRLGVLSFRVPPLRERAGAIGALAGAFCEQFAENQGRAVHGISPSALQTLQEYRWPGNLIELRNAMEYAVALAVGHRIEWCDLPEEIRNPPATANFSTFHPGVEHQTQMGLHTSLAPSSSASSTQLPGGNQLAKAREDAERSKLLATLQSNNFNRTKAAAALGISRVTLYKRMLKLNLMNGLTH